MGEEYGDPIELDPRMTIEEAFAGVNIIIRIRVDTNDPPQVTVAGGQPPPAGKGGFPKAGVGLTKPPQISVLSWDASPGCKTVIVNGVAYERCS